MNHDLMILKIIASCTVRNEIHIPTLRPWLQQLIGLSVAWFLITFFKERLLFAVTGFPVPEKLC